VTDIDELRRMAARGDWRARAGALEALGAAAAGESTIRSLAGMIARKLTGSRTPPRVAGYRGRYVRDEIANGLVDRSWPVRVVAALALGRCRSRSSTVQLRRLLSAPFRAERVAAAAALHACGAPLENIDALLADAEPLPPRIDASTTAPEFLNGIARSHEDILAPVLAGRLSPGMSAAEFLAGPPAMNLSGGLAAEVARYDADGETAYLVTKPFSRINIEQNVRLLHSFLVAAEHLRLPPGAAVLDLGGGSGWVSELLQKFGFQPFTLDLSTDLLRVGLVRFSGAQLTPRFAAADMMRLPIATSSIDGAIVMDALHHVPDVHAVLQEVARVLKPGGVFVIAEPGEGHSETERSRAEMAEHGVQESEIHVLETLALARTCGFDDVRVVPHYVPRLSMTPEQLTQAMRAPADLWMVRDDTTPRQFAPFVMQAMFDRPILVLGKGSRAADSRQRAGLRAGIQPNLQRQGRRVSGAVVLTNTGDTRWIAGAGVTGDVFLGVHLLTPERRVQRVDLVRVALTAPTDAGQSITLPMDVELPDASPWVLKLDMVAEGVCWFEEVGSRPVYVTL